MNQKNAPRARRRARGFSLFEVLVTIAIIALISGGIALALFKHFTGAQISTTKENARALRSAVLTSFLQSGEGTCPTVAQLISQGTIDEGAPDKDAWGTAYRIQCDAGKVVVSSSGPDRQQGTPDDIRAP